MQVVLGRFLSFLSELSKEVWILHAHPYKPFDFPHSKIYKKISDRSTYNLKSRPVTACLEFWLR
jgi:hypothetical protein